MTVKQLHRPAMIVCPDCLHQNPDGAVHCEACYMPLPTDQSCPNCGAAIQLGAKFCGQCGIDLIPSQIVESEPSGATPAVGMVMPEPQPPEPQLLPDPVFSKSLDPKSTISVEELINRPDWEAPASVLPSAHLQPELEIPTPAVSGSQPAPTTPDPKATDPKTQLQLRVARLRHVQTNTLLELPPHLSVIHVGKPNDRIPPDIDMAGFPNSEVISRIHADIRVEKGSFFIEDVGSSNGTYINNIPLLPGNLHRLRTGDRIALGKGDLVTFLFQLD